MRGEETMTLVTWSFVVVLIIMVLMEILDDDNF